MRLALYLISSVLITLSMTGCCEKEIVFQDRWKEKIVTSKCVVPDANCSWSGNNSLLSANMYACILQMEENIKVCKDDKQTIRYNTIK